MRMPFKALSILAIVVCIGATFAAAPSQVQTTKGMMWMVKISIPDRPEFSVAVREAGSSAKPFGVIPLNGPKLPALAVTAEQHNDDFLINLYAATTFKSGMKCQELRAMMSEPVATLTAHSGQLITTASFASYGVPSIGLLLYQKRGPVGDIRPIGCCGCGATTCCPNKGQCLDCSVCGLCCNG